MGLPFREHGPGDECPESHPPTPFEVFELGHHRGGPAGDLQGCERLGNGPEDQGGVEGAPVERDPESEAAGREADGDDAEYDRPLG